MVALVHLHRAVSDRLHLCALLHRVSVKCVAAPVRCEEWGTCLFTCTTSLDTTLPAEPISSPTYAPVPTLCACKGGPNTSFLIPHLRTRRLRSSTHLCLGSSPLNHSTPVCSEPVDHGSNCSTVCTYVLKSKRGTHTLSPAVPFGR